MPASVSNREKLLFQFKEDTITTVSRETLCDVAKRLGFNETQTLHFAVARLRDALRAGNPMPVYDEEPYPPLTAEQLLNIRSHAPKPRGKQISKESLF